MSDVIHSFKVHVYAISMYACKQTFVNNNITLDFAIIQIKTLNTHTHTFSSGLIGWFKKVDVKAKSATCFRPNYEGYHKYNVTHGKGTLIVHRHLSMSQLRIVRSPDIDITCTTEAAICQRHRY